MCESMTILNIFGCKLIAGGIKNYWTPVGCWMYFIIIPTFIFTIVILILRFINKKPKEMKDEKNT